MVRKRKNQVLIEIRGHDSFVVKGEEESLEEWLVAVFDELETKLSSLKQRVKYLEERTR